MDGILSALVYILLYIDAVVYSVINWVYRIILILCKVDILGNTFELEAITRRIYVIIGVIILFLVAYTLLKSMINPAESFKGKKSPINIIKDVIISIILIAVMPTIFTFAKDFQMALLNQNTIGNLILGSSNTSVEESSNTLIEQGGMTISTGLLQAFIHENYNKCTYDETNGIYSCPQEITSSVLGTLENDKSFQNFWRIMQNEKDIFLITDLDDDVVDGRVTYYFIISTVAGVFALFVLISYCFEIALRAVKLAVYELISPLPILSRILPNEQGNKFFQNWVKATLSTFAEVFIRLATLFFAILVCKLIIQNVPSLFSTASKDGIIIVLFSQMLLIVGVLLFIKQFPAIIKELTGLDGGKYNVLKSAKQGFALLVGGVSGGTPLAAWRAFNDAGEAKLGDFSTIGNQYKRRMAKKEAKALGSTWSDRTGDRIRQIFGYDTKLEQAKKNLDNNRDLEGNFRTITNDTGADITILGHTYHNGDQIVMTERIVNELKRLKELNKSDIAGVDESIRHQNDFKGVNNKFIEFRSSIKTEALDKIKEGDSRITDSITDHTGRAITGNYKTLTDYIQTRINSGTASEAELEALNDSLKKAEDRMWVQYANDQIAAGANTKIGSIHQQAANYLHNVGGYYDASSHSIQALTGVNTANMELFEGNGRNRGLDGLSKSNNSLIDIEIGNLESSKVQYNSENSQIDRLTANAEQERAIEESSERFQQIKAASDANNIKNNSKNS